MGIKRAQVFEAAEIPGSSACSPDEAVCNRLRQAAMMGNEFQNKSSNKYSFPQMRGREREMVAKWRKVPSHLMYLLF